LWSHSQGTKVTPIQGALCGALAGNSLLEWNIILYLHVLLGGFSAAVTTPLDVAKTRVILAEKASPEAKARLLPMVIKIGQREGLSGMFAGIVPRALGVSFGGFIFFGAYESVKSLSMR
jgi:solute carrier family 25 S-adenosylmethionine transporter 26